MVDDKSRQGFFTSDRQTLQSIQGTSVIREFVTMAVRYKGFRQNIIRHYSFVLKTLCPFLFDCLFYVRPSDFTVNLRSDMSLSHYEE